MTDDDDLLAAALTSLDVPALDPGFAARVQRIARNELVGADADAPARPLRVALGGALVPTLLAAAVVARTTETAQVTETIGPHAPLPSDQDR